jgi:hypothetical protein
MSASGFALGPREGGNDYAINSPPVPPQHKTMEKMNMEDSSSLHAKSDQGPPAAASGSVETNLKSLPVSELDSNSSPSPHISQQQMPLQPAQPAFPRGGSPSKQAADLTRGMYTYHRIAPENFVRPALLSRWSDWTSDNSSHDYPPRPPLVSHWSDSTSVVDNSLSDPNRSIICWVLRV